MDDSYCYQTPQTYTIELTYSKCRSIVFKFSCIIYIRSRVFQTLMIKFRLENMANPRLFSTNSPNFSCIIHIRIRKHTWSSSLMKIWYMSGYHVRSHPNFSYHNSSDIHSWTHFWWYGKWQSTMFKFILVFHA